MIESILGKDIASYVKRHRGLVICSLVLTAVSSLLVVIPAYLLQPFVDEGMRSGADVVSWKIPWLTFHSGSWLPVRTEKVVVENVSTNTFLFVLTCVAFVSVVLKSFTGYLSGLCSAAFANRAVRSVRIDLFKKFVSLPLSFYHHRKSGELIGRATADLTVMQARIASILTGLVQHPLTVVVFLCYLFLMNYKLTLLVFLMAPLVVGLIRLFGRKAKKHSRRVQDTTAALTSGYQEILLCIKVVHGFFRGEGEVRRFRGLAEDLYKKVMAWYRWNLGLGPLMDSTIFLTLPAVLIAGKIVFGHTLGELLSMFYAFSRVYAPVKNLAKVNTNLRTLQGATGRVFSIMRSVPEISERPGAKSLPRHRESIEFKGVNFGYHPGNLVLEDISFKIRAGEMVAFVGSTGAGKTTLLDLIPRYYDVASGSITIDGIDIRDVRLDSLRKQIGIVSQDILLFHDTIADNIRYGASEKCMEEVVAAAQAAHAHDFIMAMPAGYRTVVGDRGVLLSGGQRQRIAIARAILIDPAILILDEAASALDAESEKMVQEAIEMLQGSRTVLAAAHRLSTVMRSSRIYTLENGRIVESGTVKELLAKKGRFRQLYDLQYGGVTSIPPENDDMAPETVSSGL